MNEPFPRLRTLKATERDVAELLSKAEPIVAVDAAQAEDMIRRAMRRRTQAPRRQLVWVPALALAIVAVWSLARPKSEVEIVASPGARFAPIVAVAVAVGDTTEDRLQLYQGELRLRVPARAAERSFVVVTPRGRLIVSGARFVVRVSDNEDFVEVEEGFARFEIGDRRLDLGPGQHLRTSELASGAALRLPSPTVELRVPGCDLGAADPTLCYRRIASGTGLAAENALYALALHEARLGHHAEAITALSEHRERFRAGVLASDAAWTLVGELLLAHRYLPAVSEARAFESRYPDDQRRAEVALVAAHVLRDQLLSLPEAKAQYDRVLGASPSRDVADEALFYRGVCEEALGDKAAAAVTFVRHQAEFPRSRFADEGARRLRALR